MDNYNYDSSFNIRLYLFWTGEWIIDVEKEQPDLLGKHGLGRELTNKRGVEPRFIGIIFPPFHYYVELKYGKESRVWRIRTKSPKEIFFKFLI